VRQVRLAGHREPFLDHVREHRGRAWSGVSQRHTQVAMEQPVCLHANMDLYKCAYKLSPAVPSELVMDCFDLAREVRELDMRAAPYDLHKLGYEPVRIETTRGKAEYVAAQRGFADRAQALRRRLIAACDTLLPVKSSRGLVP
jgi:hypothetical protein